MSAQGSTMTKTEITAKAKTHKWDVMIFSISGKMRRVGLVFDRDGREDVDFWVIESGRRRGSMRKRCRGALATIEAFRGRRLDLPAVGRTWRASRPARSRATGEQRRH